MSKTPLILMGGDIALAMLAYGCGPVLWAVPTADRLLREDLWHLAALVAAILIAGFFVDLFAPEKNRWKREILLRVMIALGIVFALLGGVSFYFPEKAQPLSTVALVLGIFGLLQFTFHCGVHLLFRLPGMAEKILIFGGGPVTDQITSLLAADPHNYVVAGMIQAGGEKTEEGAPTGNPESLTGMALREKIDKIVISLTERRGVLPVGDILGCKLSGIEVVDAMSFYEQMTGKLMVEKINPSWFIFSDSSRMTSSMRFYKRVFDLLFAGIGIMLALPLFPLIALLIKIDSAGPVFFQQIRVGKGEKDFTLYKFRTMQKDAEKSTGAVWATENDPRITFVGRWLRQTRLDEMPQLFNVLRGDMSFVGPRPERPEFVAKLKTVIPYYANRHYVKPGATGWAQVKYSYGASVEDAIEKLRYDLYYIKNYSMWLDLIIILETVKVVLFGRGAR
jgi:sugar transferase (PEP-CTERM system associated)